MGGIGVTHHPERYCDDYKVHPQLAEELSTRESDDAFGANSMTLVRVLVTPARE